MSKDIVHLVVTFIKRGLVGVIMWELD